MWCLRTLLGSKVNMLLCGSSGYVLTLDFKGAYTGENKFYDVSLPK